MFHSSCHRSETDFISLPLSLVMSHRSATHWLQPFHCYHLSCPTCLGQTNFNPLPLPLIKSHMSDKQAKVIVYSNINTTMEQLFTLLITFCMTMQQQLSSRWLLSFTEYIPCRSDINNNNGYLECTTVLAISTLNSLPISRKLVDEHITIHCIFILFEINSCLKH